MIAFYAVLVALIVHLGPPDKADRALIATGPLSDSGNVIAADGAGRWGRDGHRIVCEIAYQETTDAARDMIDDLLGLDSAFDSFPESCLWADQIRGQSEYDKFRTAHYMNMSAGATTVENTPHCAVSFCVLEGIEEQSRVLSNTQYPILARLDALKFVAHFIGDLHQPLHAGYDHDRGGNSSSMDVDGETRNLHGVWDYTLIEKTGLTWEEYTTKLLSEITDTDRRNWSSSTRLEWAAESYKIVQESVYDVPEDRVFNETYYAKNIGTVETRLQQAGVRLAHVLARIANDSQHSTP